MGFDVSPSFDPFRARIEPVDLWSSGFICIKVPVRLLAYIGGGIEALRWPDSYTVNTAATSLMIAQVETWLAELGSDRQICPAAAANGGDGQGDDGGQGFEIFEDCTGCDDMTNCSVPFGALRWNADGQLEFRYCGEWYTVEGQPGQQTWEDPGEGETPDPPTSWDEATACSKATVAMDVLYDVVDALFDSAEIADRPWGAINRVHDRYPSVKFGDLQLLTAYVAAVNVAILGFDEEAENPWIQQNLKAFVSQQLSGGDQGITQTEYDAVLATIDSFLGSQWTLFTYPTSYESMRQIYHFAWQAIGPGDVNKLTTMATPTGNEDCAQTGAPVSEGGPTQPTASGWYWSEWQTQDFSCVGGFNGTKIPIWKGQQHDVYGIAIRFERSGGAPWLEGKRINEGGAIGGFSYDEYWFGTVTDHLGLNTWYCQVDNTVWTTELDGQLDNDVRPTDNTGQYSGAVGSPVATENQITYGTLVGIASGGTEVSVEGTVYVRYLRNINSASHQ